MHHSDPMHYNMEQLVRALAAETMSEISYDDAEVHNEEAEGGGMWQHIAEALLQEIDDTYSGNGQLSPYGYHADECIVGLGPLVHSYSVYPAAHKLLSALEEAASSKADPRAYCELAIRAMDSEAANGWRGEGRKYR